MDIGSDFDGGKGVASLRPARLRPPSAGHHSREAMVVAAYATLPCLTTRNDMMKKGSPLVNEGRGRTA